MRLAHILPQVFLAAALTLGPNLVQDDKPKLPPVGEQGYPWNKVGDERSEAIFKQLIGCWNLKSATVRDLGGNSRDESGVMLITHDYASFEMHMGWNDEIGGLSDWQFQSGTHRVQLDAQSNLHLTAIIGSAFNEEGDLVFLPAGVTHGYRVQVDKSKLVLTRLDSAARFEFARMPSPSTDEKKDFYGREKKKLSGNVDDDPDQNEN